MSNEPDHIENPIGSLLAARFAGVLSETLPPQWLALLDDLREKEMAANKEKTEASAPRSIATDDALGG